MRALFFLCIAVFIKGCATEVAEFSPCAVAPDTLQYTKHVYPIINQSCALPTCHVNGFEHGDFKNEADLKKAVENGTMEFMIISRQMPPGITVGKKYLTDCEINIIRTWIEKGAPFD